MGIFDNNLLLILAIYGVVILIALWVSMVIWAYRDMRSRSRDALAQLFVALVVALLNLPGLLVYILMRPRETLSEAYERSLEEEALLQEIEEKPTCPGCNHRVQTDWQVCAHCHTQLKKACIHCDHLLELAWKICPYCANEQTRYYPREKAAPTATDYAPQYAPEPPPQIPDKWLSGGNQHGNASYPQYIDEEY